MPHIHLYKRQWETDNITLMASQDIWGERKEQAAAWFRNLRDDLCTRLEAIDKDAQFQRTTWRRNCDDKIDEGGGEMSLLSGAVIEKAGVHISNVYGELSEDFRAQVRGAADDPRFWAGGISVIVHPKNPHAPTAHLNTRMIVTTQGWFGGGGDLTPLLPAARTATHQDTKDFHTAYKTICDKHNGDYYPQFKKTCDDYFYLPHRNEWRGTGGIFFDHLDSGDWQKDFAFTQDVGRCFADIYPAILARRVDMPYADADYAAQLQQRGRYVEFNLLYDRGTTFGLKTGGNVDSILSSLPPIAKW